MSEAKHAPGPWMIADYKTMNSGDHVILSPENGVDDPHPVVASVSRRPGYSANARLIAAAPDLLEACEWAMTALRHKSFCPAAEERGKCNCGIFHIENAIAKATGEAATP